jgi:hypothetical protein
MYAVLIPLNTVLMQMIAQPGIVHTDMIEELITTGADHGVHPYTLKFFKDSIDAEKGLTQHPRPATPADVPARVYAWLAVNAPMELSGKITSSYDEEITKLIEGTATAAA